MLKLSNKEPPALKWKQYLGYSTLTTAYLKAPSKANPIFKTRLDRQRKVSSSVVKALIGAQNVNHCFSLWQFSCYYCRLRNDITFQDMFQLVGMWENRFVNGWGFWAKLLIECDYS